MISFDEASRLIKLNVRTTSTEVISLDNLINRVLAESVRSPLDMPVFTNSAVDGYALLSADTEKPPINLKVATTVAAGEAPNVKIAAGEACRIFTGAPVPEGCDAVVMQEDVEVDQETIQLRTRIFEGNCIRKKGEEVRRGDPIFEKGVVVTPSVLGVLAAIGIVDATVYRQPRVTIIGTGNELVKQGQALSVGQIYESNAQAIGAAVTMAGCKARKAVTISDDPIIVNQNLADALKHSDVIITCGGVSVGAHDRIRESLTKLDVEEVFWKVAMKPGKPFYFGKGTKGQLVFGLPGNPVSALVTYLMLVKPALRLVLGIRTEDAPVKATLAGSMQKQRGRFEFIRARAKQADPLTLKAVDEQGSHMLTGLAHSDYLIWADEDTVAINDGDEITASKINWGLE